MKIKKVILYSLCLGLSGALHSCDLEKFPYESMAEDELNNIEGSIGSITIGNYAQLKNWVENWHRLTEYPGTNVSLSGTTTDHLFASYNLQRLVNSSRVNNFWTMSYKAIVGTNVVIDKIVEGESEEGDQLLAENLYLRGMLYFYLNNVFGRPYNQGADNLGVPIKLSTDVNENPPRATVGEVYQQVEEDLLRAESLFNAEKSNNFASPEAAQALLARLYLYKEENSKAIEYADKVLSSGKFNLLSMAEFPNYVEKVPEDNSETIFAIRHVKDVDYAGNGWNTIGSMYAHFLGSGWGEMYASRPYLELIRKYPSDVRYSFVTPVTLSDKLWALYVTDDYQYAYKEVTKSGDDYSYDDNGTSRRLLKESNGAGDFQYFIEIGGKKRSVLIDKEMEMRNGFPKYYITKASGQEGQSHLLSPIISRLAEIYLIRAESNAKLGNDEAALADVNVLRKRAGIPDQGIYTSANLGAKSVLDVVMEERQLELAWEGHSKFDHIRNGLTIDRHYPGTHLSGSSPLFEVKADSPNIVEFIPESQIVLSNNVLEQNP